MAVVGVRTRRTGGGRAMASVAVGAGLLAAAAAPDQAAAQRVVVFGDSLSDNGNLFATNGNPPVPYYQGRFSNGPVWVEQLYGPLGHPTLTGVTTGNVDLAYGGARTDSLPNYLGPIPGVSDQINIFKSLGGTIAPNDVVTAWAGANNIFQFFNTTPPASITPDAIAANSVAAATTMTGNVATLAGMGARTILVPNLPDLGAAPAYNGSAATASAGSYAAFTYNTALAAGMGKVAGAAPGVNIVQADVSSAFKVVLANPSAFGFTNVTQQCIQSAACVFGPAATQNSYLFWDSVHPTQAGHAVLAKYFGLLLNTAPAIAQTASLGEVPIWTSTLVTNAVFDRLNHWVSGVYAMKNGPFVEGLGQFGRYQTGSTQTASLDLGGIRAGYDRAFGNTLFGGSVAFLGGGHSGGVSADLITMRGDLYASMVTGAFFANVNGGVAHVSFDNMRRETGFPTVVAKGSTNGFVANVSGEIGVAQRMGGLTLMPIARANYIHSEVKGYTEGADILALSFADRSADGVLGSLRLRASSDIMLGSARSALFGEIGYESFLSFSGNTISAALAHNTALPVVVDPGKAHGPGVIGSIGLNSQMTDAVFVDLNYGIAVHDGGGETHSVNGRVKAHF